MLKGDNVIIRPIEEGDFELFYQWTQDKKYLGDFTDMEMLYKDCLLIIFLTLEI